MHVVSYHWPEYPVHRAHSSKCHHIKISFVCIFFSFFVSLIIFIEHNKLCVLFATICRSEKTKIIYIYMTLIHSFCFVFRSVSFISFLPLSSLFISSYTLKPYTNPHSHTKKTTTTTTNTLCILCRGLMPAAVSNHTRHTLSPLFPRKSLENAPTAPVSPRISRRPFPNKASPGL